MCFNCLNRSIYFFFAKHDFPEIYANVAQRENQEDKINWIYCVPLIQNKNIDNKSFMWKDFFPSFSISSFWYLYKAKQTTQIRQREIEILLFPRYSWNIYFTNNKRLKYWEWWWNILFYDIWIMKKEIFIY